MNNRPANRGGYISLEALNHAPLEVLWIDEDGTVVQANAKAMEHGRREGLTLLGQPHHLVAPSFPDGLLEQLLRGEQQVISYAPASGVEEEVLLLQEEEQACYVIRYGKELLLGRADAQPALSFPQEHPGPTQGMIEMARQVRTEFLANMNHEIRTPMNAIIGYAEMLAGGELAPREQRYAETIFKSGMSLVAILNDIMDLSKIDSGRLKIVKTAVRLQDIIDEVVEFYQEQAYGKSLYLENRVDGQVPSNLFLDGVRLKQVLQNLVSNAIKFTRKGGVLISVQAHPSSNDADRYDLLISVEDTGIGIPEAEQEMIANTLDPGKEEFSDACQSRGFGLSLCARLVAMMGGSITLASREGEGASFLVTLYQVGASAGLQGAGSSQEDLADSSTLEGQLTVLVVDDMELITDVFSDFFRNTTVEVLTAATPEEALDKAVEEQPNLIFMDLNLAGRDGRSVTRELRAIPQTHEIPVIVMTGNIMDESDYKPLFDDFLQKPFRLDEVRAMVERHGRGKGGEVPAAGSDQGKAEEPERPLSSLSLIWSEGLEMLLEKAIHSGSLSTAQDIGAILQQGGAKRQLDDVVALGSKLMEYATDHDIVGVEQILKQLEHAGSRRHET
ncbi:ATP-binding protein [Desulfogranum mediterraneum]|uniref:ATP-binding protein n=1 Tax=Desulfogranum mediterraneum TaxID=160661 RepID=UPI00041F4B1E|nr:ATP-binding protein [Desulfogranum mediterraneum]